MKKDKPVEGEPGGSKAKKRGRGKAKDGKEAGAGAGPSGDAGTITPEAPAPAPPVLPTLKLRLGKPKEKTAMGNGAGAMSPIEPAAASPASLPQPIPNQDPTVSNYSRGASSTPSVHSPSAPTFRLPRTPAPGVGWPIPLPPPLPISVPPPSFPPPTSPHPNLAYMANTAAPRGNPMTLETRGGLGSSALGISVNDDPSPLLPPPEGIASTITPLHGTAPETVAKKRKKKEGEEGEEPLKKRKKKKKKTAPEEEVSGSATTPATSTPASAHQLSLPPSSRPTPPTFALPMQTPSNRTSVPPIFSAPLPTHLPMSASSSSREPSLSPYVRQMPLPQSQVDVEQLSASWGLADAAWVASVAGSDQDGSDDVFGRVAIPRPGQPGAPISGPPNSMGRSARSSSDSQAALASVDRRLSDLSRDMAQMQRSFRNEVDSLQELLAKQGAQINALESGTKVGSSRTKGAKKGSRKKVKDDEDPDAMLLDEEGVQEAEKQEAVNKLVKSVLWSVMNVKKKKSKDDTTGGMIPTRDPEVHGSEYWHIPDPSKPHKIFLIPDFHDTWAKADDSWVLELYDRIRGQEGQKKRDKKVLEEADVASLTDPELDIGMEKAYTAARNKWKRQLKTPAQKAAAGKKDRVRSRRNTETNGRKDQRIKRGGKVMGYKSFNPLFNPRAQSEEFTDNEYASQTGKTRYIVRSPDWVSQRAKAMKNQLDQGVKQEQAVRTGKSGAPQADRIPGSPMLESLPLPNIDIRFISKRWLAKNPKWLALLKPVPTQDQVEAMPPQERLEAEHVAEQWARFEDSPEPEEMPSGYSSVGGAFEAVAGPSGAKREESDEGADSSEDEDDDEDEGDDDEDDAEDDE